MFKLITDMIKAIKLGKLVSTVTIWSVWPYILLKLYQSTPPGNLATEGGGLLVFFSFCAVLAAQVMATHEVWVN